jgi:hypothetical protein
MKHKPKLNSIWYRKDITGLKKVKVKCIDYSPIYPDMLFVRYYQYSKNGKIYTFSLRLDLWFKTNTLNNN